MVQVLSFSNDVLTIIATIFTFLQGGLSVIGVSMQRQAHHDVEHSDAGKEKSMYKNKKWVTGLFLYILSQPFLFISLTILPLAVVATMVSLATIIVSDLVARAKGERASWEDTCATALGLFGTCGIMQFGPKVSEQNQEVIERLTHFWDYPRTQALLPVYFALFIFSFLMRNRKNWMICHPCCCAMTGTLTDVATKILGMGFAQGWDFVMDRKIAFLCALAVWPTNGVLSLRLVSEGAKRFDNRFFMPATTCLFMIFMILFGAIAFDEIDKMPMSHIIIFLQLSLICILSVVMRAQHPVTTDDDKARMELNSMLDGRLDADMFDQRFEKLASRRKITTTSSYSTYFQD